jgi:predicted DNA binding CopG/RHH family protein
MKKNSIFDPFTNLVLDDEEKEIEAAFERGDFEEDTDFESTKRMLEDATRRHRQLSTTKPITLRINQLDLIKIKSKAKRNNIPYQTLLSIAIHDLADSKKELTLK